MEPVELTEAEIREEKRKKRKEFLINLAFALGGAGISVGSFFLFHFFPTMHFLTVVVCIVDIAYAYLNARLFFKGKDWNGARQFIIPLLLIAYWAVIFAVICIFGVAFLKNEFTGSFFIYPIFLMPAFVIEIIVLCLVAEGLSYA